MTATQHITHADQMKAMNFEGQQCKICDEVTANLCAQCGTLKHDIIQHTGRLPDGAHEVLAGKTPSWKMLRTACVLSALAGASFGAAIALQF